MTGFGWYKRFSQQSPHYELSDLSRIELTCSIHKATKKVFNSPAQMHARLWRPIFLGPTILQPNISPSTYVFHIME